MVGSGGNSVAEGKTGDDDDNDDEGFGEDILRKRSASRIQLITKHQSKFCSTYGYTHSPVFRLSIISKGKVSQRLALTVDWFYQKLVIQLPNS